MTIKTGQYQKNELISGLASHQFVKETYGTKYMLDDKNMLEELVRLLHKNIIKVHEKIRKKYFWGHVDGYTVIIFHLLFSLRILE